MLQRAVIYDGATQRQLGPGDTTFGGELINSSITTVGAATISAAVLISGIINRTGPTAGYTDTTDSAQNIISNLLASQFVGTGALAGVGILSGLTFRVSYINTVAFAMTLAAGAGVTLGANTGVSASSVKDYLVTITNGTPTQVYAVTQTNASAVITGLTQLQTQALSVGQLVTGTNIPANTTIISIQPGVGVTLSAAATATLSLNAITFSPTVRVDSLGQKLL